jgi:hypothetical protein
VTASQTKLNLIRQHSENGAKRARVSTSFQLGGYKADIIMDQKTDPPIHHWIIQQVGSPEILYWGQEYTYEQAEAASHFYIRSLAERQSRTA